jgi:hypothetical protein
VCDWASAAVGNASMMARPASGMIFMRFGMRCRLSPTADVSSHTSGAGMGQKQNPPHHSITWSASC